MFGAKPWSEPMPTRRYFDRWKQMSMTFESKGYLLYYILLWYFFYMDMDVVSPIAMVLVWLWWQHDMATLSFFWPVCSEWPPATNYWHSCLAHETRLGVALNSRKGHDLSPGMTAKRAGSEFNWVTHNMALHNCLILFLVPPSPFVLLRYSSVTSWSWPGLWRHSWRR